jgi:hypothetical protein
LRKDFHFAVVVKFVENEHRFLLRRLIHSGDLGHRRFATQEDKPVFAVVPVQVACGKPCTQGCLPDLPGPEMKTIWRSSARCRTTMSV